MDTHVVHVYWHVLPVFHAWKFNIGEIGENRHKILQYFFATADLINIYLLHTKYVLSMVICTKAWVFLLSHERHTTTNLRIRLLYNDNEPWYMKVWAWYITFLTTGIDICRP